MAATDRVAVIGAGPIGLYAAFRLVKAGHRVVIWEKGSIGANVESWGHVTLFSSMALNLRADARADLERGLGAAAPPRALPPDDACHAARNPQGRTTSTRVKERLLARADDLDARRGTASTRVEDWP